MAVGSLLSVTCAIPLGRPRMSAGPTVDPSAEKRRPANEVLLTVRGEPPVRGKLVGIDGEDVAFLPTPYWNLAPRKVKVGDIAAIEITDMGRAKGRSAGYSFAAAFVLVGAICAAGSKYDEDYKDCLLGSAAVGGVASLVGFAVGAGVDRAHPRSYRFEAMKPEEKRKAIQGLVAR